MNKKIFKVVWNKVRGDYVVTSEKADSVMKPKASVNTSRSTDNTLVATLVVSVLLGACSSVIFADNSPNTVVGGTGTASANETNNAIAIGDGANAPGIAAISIGYKAGAGNFNGANDAVTIGRYTQANGSGAIAIGGSYQASGVDFSDGSGVYAPGTTYYNTVAGRDSIAIGYANDLANSYQGINMGARSRVQGTGNIVFGSGETESNRQEVRGTKNTVIGNYNKINADGTVTGDTNGWAVAGAIANSIIGSNNTLLGSGAEGSATSTEKNTVLGSNNTIHAGNKNNLVLGSGNTISDGVKGSYVLGGNSKITESNTVYIGDGSVASLIETTYTAGELGSSGTIIGGKQYTFAGKGSSDNGVITVGKYEDGSTIGRVIQNLAPGALSPTSTDAINGSQLYSVIDSVNGDFVRKSALTSGSISPFIYTDAEGNKLLKDKKGNFYRQSDIEAKGYTITSDGQIYKSDKVTDGVPDADAVAVSVTGAATSTENGASAAKAVDKNSIIISAINPNQDGADATVTPTLVKNVASALGTAALGNGATEYTDVDGSPGSNEFIKALRAGSGRILNSAATFGDLKNLSNTPLFFYGDIGNHIERKLGEKLSIKGGVNDSDKLTDNNIGVTSTEGDNTLTVKLAKNLQDLKTVAVSDSVTVAKDGKTTTIAPDKVITEKVTGLTNPTDNSDAVNKGYVDDKLSNTIKLSGNTGDTATQALNKENGLAFGIKGDGTDITTAGTGDNVTITLHKATEVAENNTSPVTSGAVYTAITNATNNTVALGGDGNSTTATQKLSKSGGLKFDITGNDDIVTNATGSAVTLTLQKSETVTSGDHKVVTGDAVSKAIKDSITSYQGDNSDVTVTPVSKKVKVLGGADSTKLSDNNIGTVGNTDGSITVKLANELTGLKEVKIDTDQPGKTIIINNDGIDTAGKEISGVKSSLPENTNSSNALTNLNNLASTPEGKAKVVTAGDISNIANALTNKGLVFAGDKADTSATKNDFTTSLGAKVKVLGGATGDVTDNNIAVVSNGTDTLTVKLAKDLADLNTVSAATSVTVGPKAGKRTTITPESITTEKVTGLDDPTGDKDAVNKKYVDTKLANKIKLGGNEGTTDGQALNKDGGIKFDVKGSDDGDITTSASESEVVLKLNKSTTVAENDNKAVTSNAVYNAIKDAKDALSSNLSASGWNIQQGGNAVTGGSDSKVNPDNTVNFVDGTGTTAHVETTDGNTFAVKYSVNTATLSADNSGNVTSTDPTGNSFATAGNVANVVNSAIDNNKFKFYASKDTDTKVTPVDKAFGILGDAKKDATVAAGNIVTSAEAGKVNIALSSKLNNLQEVVVGTGDEAVTIAPNAIKVGDKTYVTMDGLNASGQRVSNVANGKKDTDAVNVSQLKAVTKAASSKVVAGDNIVVNSETDDTNGTTYTITTAKDLTVESVTAGNTTVNTEGVTVGAVKMTANGIEAGGNKVSGVADGDISSTSKDAINGSQLYNQGKNVAAIIGVKAATISGDGVITVSNIGGTNKNTIDEAIRAVNTASKAAKTEVKAGDNITVDSSMTGTDGQAIYTVSTKDKVAFKEVKVDGVVIDNKGINAGNMAIEGVAAGNVAKDSNQAVNGSQLHNTAKSVADALGGDSEVNDKGEVTAPSYKLKGTGGDKNTVNNIGGALNFFTSQIVKPITFAGTDGSHTAQLGDTVNITGANGNITTSVESNNVKIHLEDDLNIESVTTGNTKVDNDGVTIKSAKGDVKLTANGLNNGGNPITNVREGVANNDVATVGQVKGVAQQVNRNIQAINQLGNHVNNIDRKLKGGIAGNSAMASLPQAYIPGHSMVAIAGGHYSGKSAIALGVSRISDSGHVVIKLNAATNSVGGTNVGAGIGYQW